MLGCKPTNTSMDHTIKLGIIEGSSLVDKGRYQRFVGKLISLSHTKPNVAFLVNVDSQFLNNPIEEYMKVVYRILKYLKMTLGKGLYFKRAQKRNIEFFSNVD